MSFLPSVERLPDSNEEAIGRDLASTTGLTRSGGVRVKKTPWPGPGSSAGLPVAGLVGDRLFSRTSLRNITAANIREREELVQKYRSIETAARTAEARLEHETTALRRKAERLRARLGEKPWQRLLRRRQAATSAEGESTDRVGPEAELRSSGRRRSGDRERSAAVATMDDVRRLARRLCAPTAAADADDVEPPEALERRERLVVDFLVRMVVLIEEAVLDVDADRRSDVRRGRFNGEAFSKLVTALRRETPRSPHSASSFFDGGVDAEKRRRYLDGTNVAIIRLPPVYSAEPLELRPRDWDINERTPPPPKLTDRDWSELRRCRYLRYRIASDVGADQKC